MFAVVALTLIGCDPSASDTENSFAEGRRLITIGDFEGGRMKLNDYLSSSPNGAYASRAVFFHAKSHLGQGHLSSAKVAFQDVIRRFPNSPEAHKSHYKLALIHFLEGDTEAARKGFGDLVAVANGSLLPEAKAMLRYLTDGR
ncbi:MAG: tetratricopeptide repeat protein [Gammaproteobacteria bacterium]|nr:tetratricopeptide repeat protein [Gammaproteobacteria bacterium]